MHRQLFVIIHQTSDEYIRSRK